MPYIHPSLKRTKPMKRSWIRRAASWARTKIDRVLNKLRLTYRQQNCCALCGRMNPESVHEIYGGNQFRHRTKYDPRFWLPLCVQVPPGHCHSIVQGWPKARQWALKILCNDGYFDEFAIDELKVKPVERHQIAKELAWLIETDNGRRVPR